MRELHFIKLVYEKEGTPPELVVDNSFLGKVPLRIKSEVVAYFRECLKKEKKDKTKQQSLVAQWRAEGVTEDAIKYLTERP